MFRYIGSKLKLSDFILPHIPTDIKKYIEPFGGSMGIYFNIDINKFKDVEFIYNDINPLNSNLFKKLKSEKFIQQLKSIELNVDKFDESFHLVKSKSSTERAIAWSIILTSCQDISNLDKRIFTGSENFNLFRFKVSFYKNHLDRLKILNVDYQKIILENDNSDTFFYIDPPYFGTEHFYKYSKFDSESHTNLHKILTSLKSKWILSYKNFPEMEDWYKDFKIISKKHNFSTEFIIMNF